MLAKTVLAAALAGAVALGAPGQQPPSRDPGGKEPARPGAEGDAYVLGFTMKRLDGTDQNLADYKGKVLVIVNVASRCGYTPQYEALQKLYEQKKDRGLVVLGFPANNFGKQEPGTNAEIAQFCSSKFGVTFPMFEKVSVKGDDQHPLYKKLASQPAPVGGDPKWNFTKFIVDRSGRVVARFDAKTKGALEPGLAEKVEELLGEDAGKPAASPPSKAAPPD